MMVQLGVVDERLPFLSSVLHLARSQFFLSNTKKGMVLRVVPKDTHAWHLFVKGTHFLHLCFVLLSCQFFHF